MVLPNEERKNADIDWFAWQRKKLLTARVQG
jgi:hypothetical protein